jgi:hypothetical protein
VNKSADSNFIEALFDNFIEALFDNEDGPLVLAHACKLGLEGIVSKRRDSLYRSGARRIGSKARTRLVRR